MPVTFPFLGQNCSCDTSDFMRKSVYDTNNDGVVDKLNKLIDIVELEEGFDYGEIPKVDALGNSAWAVDDTTDIDEVRGGQWGTIVTNDP